MGVYYTHTDVYKRQRQTYANVADGAAASQKTEEQKEASSAALQNQHFRIALARSIDRATYVSQSLGEEMCIRDRQEAAYESEVIRAALMSVDRKETEAAKSIGMTSIQTLWRITIPQALVVAVPSFGNCLLYTSRCV